MLQHLLVNAMRYNSHFMLIPQIFGQQTTYESVFGHQHDQLLNFSPSS
jgi:hypothetical protein